jgi:HD superfamily phosphodiesterase
MKILAIEKENPGKRQKNYKPYLKEEAKIVWMLYRKGIFREIYFRENPRRAVIIMEAENIDYAREKLSELPLVKNNLISFELLVLHPYHGFERLFE